MRTSPLRSVLPTSIRARRITVGLVVPSLVAGSFAAISLAAVSAAADPTVGTFTIGSSAVLLNQPSDPGFGTITPTADATTNGMFGAQQSWPIVPLHASVSRNGKLVTWGTPINVAEQGGLTYDVWDPTAGFSTAAHTDYTSGNSYDSFCNAFTELADGRLLMIGGNSNMTTMTFDSQTGAQVMEPNLNHPRWYGTALRLTDGRILMLGGQDYSTNPALTAKATLSVATTPEIGTGTSSWTDLTGATSDTAFGLTDNRWWYPRAFNGPNGTVVGTSANVLWTLTTAGTGSVSQVGTLPWNPGVSGSQVMYAPGKELIAGGGQQTNVDDNPGMTNAAVIDWTTATPTVTSTGSMAYPANWLNLTVLPTGEVFANGGTKVGVEGHDATNDVLQSEIWNPGTGAWRLAASAQRTRTYHSTSLVMPSGAVFTGGGGIPGPETNFNAEMYYPAYLFTKAADGTVQWASRPAISAISGSATYGGTVALTIADGRAIGGASLISLPSVTHSENTDQRRIPLTVTQSGATVSATLPTSKNTLPPGDYELTVTDANGVPSAAQIITIRDGAAGLVTVAPTTPSTTASTPAPTMSMGATGGTGGTVASPSTGTGSTAGSGTTTAPSTGTSPSTGTGSSTGSGTTTAPTTGSVTTAVTLPVGKAISIAPGSHTSSRVSRSGTTITIRAASTRSSKAVRAATSWIVHTGFGSKKGYSFESVSKPGYYLAAPASGSGKMTLVKRSGSASFKRRTTFSSVLGPMRHDIAFELTAKTSMVMRLDGSRIVIGGLPRSDSGLRAATFVAAKGLASRR